MAVTVFLQRSSQRFHPFPLLLAALAFAMRQSPPVTGVSLSIGMGGVTACKPIDFLLLVKDLRLQVQQILAVQTFELAEYGKLVIFCHQVRHPRIATVFLVRNIDLGGGLLHTYFAL
jgi:hypothetical protein